MKVVAPTHPLFGRCFPLRHRPRSRAGQSHVLTVYDDKGVHLRLPLAATELDPSTPSLQTKLNAQAVAEFGRLDAAFNNAGVQSPIAETADASVEEFDRVNAINLRGVFRAVSA